LTVAQLNEVNRDLREMEAALTDSRGLPGRDWFKHLVYAPGVFTGYGVKTLPGVREAIEANRWDEANQYTAYTAAALMLSSITYGFSMLEMQRGRLSATLLWLGVTGCRWWPRRQDYCRGHSRLCSRADCGAHGLLPAHEP